MQRKGRTALLTAAMAIAVASTPALASSPKDIDITTWVKSALRHDPHVDPAGIKIQVRKGVVTLTGGVSNLTAKKFALGEAKKINGVVGVIDELYVKTRYRPDSDIVQDVRHRIVDNAMIESSSIVTVCEDGVVTLTGDVDSWAEKQEAGVIAGEVTGVKKVVNDLSIIYTGTRSDQELKKDAEARLDTDVYLNGLPIKIEVENGVVTLTGSVGSQFEMDRAERKLRYMAEVRDVKNNLTVKFWEKGGTRVKASKPPTDRELKKDVKRALEVDSRVDASKIDVDASYGNVILNGTVPYSYEARVAEQDARDTIGTAWVTDHLTVAGAVRDDFEIRSDILSNFDSDYSLGGMDITVRVNKGAVTLDGYVNTNWEKQHARDVARRIRGVKKVKNHIKVERDQYSDIALANEVRKRLDHNWITSPVHKDIIVSVDGGVATLAGDVDTWSERAEAARVTLGTEGVWSVVNRMTVLGVEYPWDEWVDEVTVVEPYWWVWPR